jgi:hypothetical protein
MRAVVICLRLTLLSPLQTLEQCSLQLPCEILRQIFSESLENFVYESPGNIK